MAPSESTVLQFTLSSTSLSAKVHPLVIFNICDCYVRRPDQAERVISTLLGSVSPDGTFDIRNSYAVPHNEFSDQEGHAAPDNNIGRFIADTVASLPKMSPSTFDKLMNDSLQDHLVLLYLSSITRTQLSLAEKLNTAAQNL